jgi:hypothetical protein
MPIAESSLSLTRSLPSETRLTRTHFMSSRSPEVAFLVDMYTSTTAPMLYTVYHERSARQNTYVLDASAAARITRNYGPVSMLQKAKLR